MVSPRLYVCLALVDTKQLDEFSWTRYERHDTRGHYTSTVLQFPIINNTNMAVVQAYEMGTTAVIILKIYRKHNKYIYHIWKMYQYLQHMW
jgi:hypothetical protein